MKINTNMAAQQILNNLNKADSKSAKTMERLSSGLRINRASDDAAGMAIANKMSSQVKGLQQANRNAMDGISMIQTAEGAMNEIHSILQRVRELTVQAANGTYTDEDKSAISSEIDELMKEMTAIQKNTEYNKISLLNGSQASIPLQVGANANQNLVIDGAGMDLNQMLVGINGITADRIAGAVQDSDQESEPEVPGVETDNKADGLQEGMSGVSVIGAGEITGTTNTFNGDFIIKDGTVIEGNLIINGNVKLGNNVTIKGELTVIGDISSGSGLNLEGNSLDVTGNLKLDGAPVAVDSINVDGSVELGGTGTITKLSGEIINITLKDDIVLDLESGITISGDLNSETTGTIDVAGNLTIEGNLNVVSSGEISVDENLNISGDLNIAGTGTVTAENDINVEGNASLSSDMISNNGNVTVNGIVNTPERITATNGEVTLGSIIVGSEPPIVEPEPVPPTPVEETKEIIINGERIELTQEQVINGIDIPAGSVVSVKLPEEISITVDGKNVTIPAGEQMVMQIGESSTRWENGKITLSEDDSVRFPGVEELEVLNQSTLNFDDIKGTDKALESIDRAITANSTMRSKLGAYQNRLEHTVSNLGTTQENMTESLSRIQDADMAEEMASYTQTNVLTQAATAMLAQANQRPQQVLQLLNS